MHFYFTVNMKTLTRSKNNRINDRRDELFEHGVKEYESFFPLQTCHAKLVMMHQLEQSREIETIAVISAFKKCCAEIADVNETARTYMSVRVAFK